MHIFKMLGAMLALCMMSLAATPAFAFETATAIQITDSFNLNAFTAGAVVLTMAMLGLTPMLKNYQPVFSIPGEGDGRVNESETESSDEPIGDEDQGDSEPAVDEIIGDPPAEVDPD